MRLIYLDTETTSIWEDRWMIQLAYKIIENWKVVKVFNEYFVTEKKIEIWAKAIHNITEEILDQKWKELNSLIKTEITEDIEDWFIIAHNSDFDKETLKLEWFLVDDWKWIDSYNIAYNLLTEDMVEAYNLQYLRYYFYPQDIEFSEGITAHDALWDILVLEKVFEQLNIIYSDQYNFEKDSVIKYQEMVNDTNKWIILRVCKFPKHRWKLWTNVLKDDIRYIHWIRDSVDMDKNLKNTINFLLKM